MIISPDKNGQIDPVVYDLLKNVKSEVPLVPITRVENFVFNDDLLNLDKYVLVDFIEYGWDWDMWQTHLFGMNTYSPPFDNMFYGAEWAKFNLFICERQPILYFKREQKENIANRVPRTQPNTTTTNKRRI